MKDCNCIIIDDKRGFAKSALITNFLKQAYSKNQININLIQLNPKDEKFVNEDGEILKAEVAKELDTSQYLRQSIQLIACDYDLADEKLNGFEIIRILRNELGCKKKIILYSSNIDDVVDKIIDGKKQEVVQRVIDLVNSNISEFCKRDEHLIESMLKHLRDESVFSTDKFFEQELYRYKAKKFNNVYDKFEDKTLGEIAEIISKNPSEGERFKREIIEQVIAHMIFLDNE